jgi:hypothetical protein
MGRHRLRRKAIIKIYMKAIEHERMDWMQLVECKKC